MKKIHVTADSDLNIINYEQPKISLGDSVVIELASDINNEYSLSVDFRLPNPSDYNRTMTLVSPNLWRYEIPNSVLQAVSKENNAVVLETIINAFIIINNTENENLGYTNKLGTFTTAASLPPIATSGVDYAVVLLDADGITPNENIWQFDAGWLDSGLKEKKVSISTATINIEVDKFVQNTQEFIDTDITAITNERLAKLENDNVNNIGVDGDKVVQRDLVNRSDIPFVSLEGLGLDQTLLYADANDILTNQNNPAKLTLGDIVSISANDKGEYATFADLLTTFPDGIANPTIRAGWFAIVIEDGEAEITVENEKIVWVVDTNSWLPTGETKDVTRSEFDNLEARVVVNENDIIGIKNTNTAQQGQIDTLVTEVIRVENDSITRDNTLQANIDGKLDKDFNNFANKAVLNGTEQFAIRDGVDNKNVTANELLEFAAIKNNNKFTFNLASELLIAHPSGADGDFAFVTTDDVTLPTEDRQDSQFWKWDVNEAEWRNSHTDNIQDFVEQTEYNANKVVVNDRLTDLEDGKIDRSQLEAISTAEIPGIPTFEFGTTTIKAEFLPQSFANVNSYQSLSIPGDPNSTGLLVPDAPTGAGTIIPFVATPVEQLIKEFAEPFTTGGNVYTSNDTVDYNTVFKNLQPTGAGQKGIAKNNASVQAPFPVDNVGAVKVALIKEVTSNDLDLIDYDVNNDFVLKDENALGYRLLVTVDFTNATANDVIATVFTYREGVEIDKTDITINSTFPAEAQESKTFPVSVRDVVLDDTITFEIVTDNALAITVERFIVLIESNFTDLGDAASTYFFRYEHILRIQAVEYVLNSFSSNVSAVNDTFVDQHNNEKSELTENRIANVGDTIFKRTYVSSNIDDLAGGLLVDDDQETTQITYNRAGQSGQSDEGITSVYQGVSQTLRNTTDQINRQINLNNEYNLASFVAGTTYELEFNNDYTVKDRGILHVSIPENANDSGNIVLEVNSVTYNIADYKDVFKTPQDLSGKNIKLRFDVIKGYFIYDRFEEEVDTQIKDVSSEFLAIKVADGQYKITSARTLANRDIFYIKFSVILEDDLMEFSVDNGVTFYELFNFEGLRVNSKVLSETHISIAFDGTRFNYKEPDKVINDKLAEKVNNEDFNHSELLDVDIVKGGHVLGYDDNGIVVSTVKTIAEVGDTDIIIGNLASQIMEVGITPTAEIVFDDNISGNNTEYEKSGNGVKVIGQDKNITLNISGTASGSGVNSSFPLSVTGTIYKNGIATTNFITDTFNSAFINRSLEINFENIASIINDVFTIKVTLVSSHPQAVFTFNAGNKFKAITVGADAYKIPATELKDVALGKTQDVINSEKLDKAGGIMTGDITMGTNRIKNSVGDMYLDIDGLGGTVLTTSPGGQILLRQGTTNKFGILSDGTLWAGDNRLTALGNPTGELDAVNLRTLGSRFVTEETITTSQFSLSAILGQNKIFLLKVTSGSIFLRPLSGTYAWVNRGTSISTSEPELGTIDEIKIIAATGNAGIIANTVQIDKGTTSLWGGSTDMFMRAVSGTATVRIVETT